MNFACPVGACVGGPGKNFLGRAQMVPEGTVALCLRSQIFPHSLIIFDKREGGCGP